MRKTRCIIPIQHVHTSPYHTHTIHLPGTKITGRRLATYIHACTADSTGGSRSRSPRAESAPPPVTGDVPASDVSEILRPLHELQEQVRNCDGVVQQLRLKLDVMTGAASPPRRRSDDETEPVVVGATTTPQSPPVAPRAWEDDDVIATNTKEDLKLWRNP